MAQAQAPVIDGQITPNEYGSSSYVTGEQTWYMSWDETNLYVATTFAGVGEATVMYFDTDPDRSMIVNNVNNAGTTEGFGRGGSGYDNTSGTLPFSADAVVYVKPANGYREVRRYSAELGRWADEKPGFGSIANNSNNVREFSIPWSEISTTGSRPANFNWFGYVTNGSGFVYAQVPYFNPGRRPDSNATIGTDANFVRYFTVLNTAAGSNTRAFGPNNVDSYSHSGTGVNTFGPITVYDFTLNTPGALITRASTSTNPNPTWNIQGNLRVNSGTLNLGDSPASVSVASNLGVFDSGVFRYTNQAGTLRVGGNLEFDNPGSVDIDAAVNLTGNNDQTISGGDYRSLTILGNGIKTLSNNDLNIETALVLNGGTLVTGARQVNLGTTGRLTEDNGYLLGMVTSTKTIQGPGSATFGDIGLTITSPNSAPRFPGTVFVQRITGGFGIDAPTSVPTANKTIRRRFFVNASNDNPVGTTIAFTYRAGNPNEREGNSASQNLKLYQSADRTFGYAPVTTGESTHDNSSRTVTFVGQLVLDGYFSLADGNNPLPVELISFTGQAENNAVRLSWATASEKQNKGFEIERRTDQSEWQTLSFVAGNGTTNQRHNYSYLDRSAGAGNNYYRLRQIDLDGKSVYSQPVSVQMGAVAFTLSPVPTTDVLTLNGLGAGKHTTEIYNVRGQRVLSQTFSDETATTLTVSTLPAGVYMVRVLGPDRGVRKARFIKQ